MNLNFQQHEIKMKYLLVIVIIASTMLILFSCKQKEKQNFDSKIIYHDINMLGRILNLSNYKPDRVIFKYSAILNSIEGKQPSMLPGPEDYVIEAVLFFKPEIIGDLKKKLNDKFMYPKDENELLKTFQFNWLPDPIKNEINKIKKVKKYPGTIFYDTGDSEMLILPDKVIIYALTQ